MEVVTIVFVCWAATGLLASLWFALIGFHRWAQEAAAIGREQLQRDAVELSPEDKAEFNRIVDEF